MRKLYLLFFLSLASLAQVTPRVQPIPNPKGLEDFEHQFKGCPENSECDQTMGQDLLKWQDLISKLNKDIPGGPKRAMALETFRSLRGIPVDFYSTRKSQQGFKPLLYGSSCKQHQSKNEDQRIFKGTAFVKGIDSKKAIVWRNNALVEVPVGELFVPQSVVVHFPEGPTTFYLPLMDQPLFIKGKELFILREEEGTFYTLKVSDKGEWKIVDIDQTRLLSWEDKRENVKCPVEKIKSSPKEFQNDFCKTVWDEDSKKTVIVKMSEGCSI